VRDKNLIRLAGAIVVVLLQGCEAPLVLDGVKAQADQPTQRSDLLQAIASNDQVIVAVGNRGVVLRSADAGQSWERRMLDGGPFLMDIDVCPDGRFAALSATREVWIGSADASDWQPTLLQSDETPQALTCDMQGRLWVVGSFSTIWRSDDMGRSWQETSLDEDLYFTTIQFVDDQFGFMTGEFGTVARSTDGGESWEMLTPIAGDFYPQDALFLDRDNGWVVGLTGTVLRTTDGGESWVPEITSTDAPFYGIDRRGDDMYLVGGFGTVMKRAPDGHWDRVEHDQPIRFYLRGLKLTGDGQLVAAGGAGALLVMSI
jgi:photosystem II stability/assembly factor-like uncharacterized protein